MVLEGLSNSLRTALKKIMNAPYVDSSLVRDILKDIQRALIQADVNVHLVLSLTKEIERRALTEKPQAGMGSREHVVKILYEELLKIVGTTKPISLKKQRLMLVGLYGQGKTTTVAKLARYYQKRGLKCGIIAADTHRPAALDQLIQLGEKMNIEVYGIRGETKAGKIVKEGIEKFKEHDAVLIDTSGRHSLEQDLIKEMKAIATLSSPDEKILVIDATIGQQAGPQAKAFNEAIGITSVIVTKLDGSAKGGGALSAVAEVKAPILFIGTGEHIEDIEKFEPQGFISRLFGMGDIQTLLEKTKGIVDEAKAEEAAEKIISGKFTLKELCEQIELLSDMGPLKKIVDLLPFGLTEKVPKGYIDDTQAKLKKFKVLISSMTKEEMENPRIIKGSRIRRIAIGSGTTTQDVKALLRYYNMTRKAVRGFAGNRKMRRLLLQQLKMNEDDFK
ncbi:MAG: signal recognition particle protein Srp54 [Candidatus Thermoplasmatota archaeon]